MVSKKGNKEAEKKTGGGDKSEMQTTKGKTKPKYKTEDKPEATENKAGAQRTYEDQGTGTQGTQDENRRTDRDWGGNDRFRYTRADEQKKHRCTRKKGAVSFLLVGWFSTKLACRMVLKLVNHKCLQGGNIQIQNQVKPVRVIPQVGRNCKEGMKWSETRVELSISKQNSKHGTLTMWLISTAHINSVDPDRGTDPCFLYIRIDRAFSKCLFPRGLDVDVLKKRPN